MVFAVALVIVRSPPHFALHDHDQFFPQIQFNRPPEHIGDAGQQFRDEFQLILVIVGMAALRAYLSEDGTLSVLYRAAMTPADRGMWLITSTPRPKHASKTG